MELEQCEFHGWFLCVGRMGPGLCFETFVDKGMIFQLNSFNFHFLSDMGRFIYLVVSKHTGRTCNAHQVIGGDVLATAALPLLFH